MMKVPAGKAPEPVLRTTLEKNSSLGVRDQHSSGGRTPNLSHGGPVYVVGSRAVCRDLMVEAISSVRSRAMSTYTISPLACSTIAAGIRAIRFIGAWVTVRATFMFYALHKIPGELVIA